MQNSNTSEIDPLHPEEAIAAWQEYCQEVVTNILRFIKKMGYLQSLKRQLENLESSGRYVPTSKQIGRVLAVDLEVQTDIFERVKSEFQKAVANGQVDRNHVGGWLNCATKRKTWKVAIPRARHVVRELSAYGGGTEVVANAGTADDSPEDLLILHEFAKRYARFTAGLTIEDKQLFDAKIAGRGYSDLAIARGKTPEALKTEASRLCKRIEHAVRSDEIIPTMDTDDEEAEYQTRS